MADWKDDIKLTLKKRNDAQTAEETRRQTEATASEQRNAENCKSLKEVITPALAEIKDELVNLGLHGDISETLEDACLNVFENGKRRFSYTVSSSGNASVRATGGSASTGRIPLEGTCLSGEDIKRHFGAEFQFVFSQKG
jgi:hypothetical protein